MDVSLFRRQIASLVFYLRFTLYDDMCTLSIPQGMPGPWVGWIYLLPAVFAHVTGSLNLAIIGEYRLVSTPVGKALLTCRLVFGVHLFFVGTDTLSMMWIDSRQVAMAL